MATVLVRFDGGNVPIVSEDIPRDDKTPIENAVLTGFVTNTAFIVAEGVYCLGLDIVTPYVPLWQLVQAIDGERAEINFHSANGGEVAYFDIDPPIPWPGRR